MANTLRFKRGLASGLPTGVAGEPLFTTDTFDLYIGNGTTNTRFQKYIASGATTQILRGDGSLYTFPLAISSPSAGQVLKYNGTSWVNDSDAGITGSGSAGQVAYFTGATTQAGSNNLFWDSANVRLGINTASPQRTLHLIGTGDTFIRVDGQSLQSLFGTDNVGAYMGMQSNAALRLVTNATERVRIFATGNFGINTGATDSGQRLQVIGTGYFSDTLRVNGNIAINAAPPVDVNFYVRKSLSGSVFPAGIYIDGNIASTSTSGAAYFNTNANTDNAVFTLPNLYHFRATTGTLGASATITNQFGYFVDGNVVGATNNFAFYGNIAAATGRWNLYMNGTANNYMAGNLGMGSTNPLTKVHIRTGNAASTLEGLRLANGSNDPNAGNRLSFYFSDNSANIAGAFMDVVKNGSDGNIIFSTSAANAAPTEALRIVGNGNVGIGTNNPYAGKLHISGANGVNNSFCLEALSAGGASFRTVMTQNATNGSFTINLDAGSNVASSDFVIQGFGTELLRLKEAGNLLLGSATDSGEKLQVTGTMKVTGASSFGGNMTLSLNQSASTILTISNTTNAASANVYARVTASGGSIDFGKQSGSSGSYKIIAANDGFVNNGGAGDLSIFNDVTTGNIKFAAGGSSTTQMLLNASGNLGLGVTPSAWRTTERALQIGTYTSVTDVFGYSTFGNNYFVNSSSQYIFLNSARASVYSQNAGVHAWSTSTTSGTAGNAITFTQAMTLDASGNLGVGTASPSRRLSVVGTTDIISYSNGTTTGYLYSDNNGVGLFNGATATGTGIYARTSNILDLYYNGSIGLRLNNLGRILIGSITDSGEQFQVTGTAKITGAATFSSSVTAASYRFGSFAGGDFDDYAIYVNATGATNGTTIASVANTSIRFRTNFATRLTIDGSGNMAVDTNTLFVDATNNRVGILTTTPSYSLDVQGTGYFNDNVRFPNNKGVIFVQTGGTLLGSISMDTTNRVTIANNGFSGLSVATDHTFLGGNFSVGHSGAVFGGGTRAMSMLNGTAPTSSFADAFLMYSNDVTAGNAAPHFRTENGAVIKLYQETTAVGNAIVGAGGGSAMLDDDTFDGYTLRQVVRALRNQGILQ